jgi:outer membrane protein assembly factor BamB
MKKLGVLSVLVVLVSAPALADVVDLAKSSGVQGGIIVHLGCGDGRETAKLLLDDRYLVHGLDTDPGKVEEARKNIQALGLYGKVSAAVYDGTHLPYVNDLVNLVIIEPDARVAESEILRILAPGGVAMKDGRKIVKPWPDAIDQWTHFLHGPDNNAVARDRQVDVPRSIQWVSEPRWGRSHEELASLSAAVTANGRIYAIIDEAPLASIRFLGDWHLVARDAFNGTLLWKKPVPQWTDHLRHFRSGPAHLPRRLVAVGDRAYVTLGLASPVVCLDGATGNVLCEYEGSERTEEIVVSDGVLYLVAGTSEADRRGGGLFDRGEPAPVAFRRILAFEAGSGKPLWTRDFTRENVLPLTLAVKGGRVYFQSTQGIVCLDARSGKDLWKAPRPTPTRRMSFSAPTLVATEEVILSADRDVGKGEEDSASDGTLLWGVHGWNERGFARKGKCTLRAYAARDGKELWSAPCQEGYNSPVDLFVVNGVVWVGPGFQGLDLRTGQPRGQINTSSPRVGMAHHRCYRDKATERFILTGRSGIEMLSLEKGAWLSNNSWIRGTCQYGILPANGFLYAPPDACACFLTVKVAGFFAAAPQRDKTGHLPFPARPVLEKGPLYGQTLAAGAAGAEDWPMYRHDAARSGTASSAIPGSPVTTWCTPVGGRLTQPAVAGGKVFVAAIDAHTVHALSADTGREVWRFTAGGRVDSTPTVCKGRVFFGSADGWVYSVGANDGRLAWRFRAAPAERFICACGQLESVWPVHGAVLVQNDTLYVTAGRDSYLDGGIVLYRVDPATGQELSRTVLSHIDPDTGKQLTQEARFNMEGTTSDILSGDGENVYLKYFAFDREGKRTQSDTPHLFAIAGLLGEEWFVRSYWIIGAGMPGAGWSGWANAANKFPFGRILSFDKDVVYGYGRKKVSGGPVGHRADAYHLFAENRGFAAKPTPAADKKGRRGKNAAAKGDAGKPLWSRDDSLIVRAMALGGNRLAISGPPDLGKKAPNLLTFQNSAEALAGFEGQRGVYLRIIGADDGGKIAEIKLPAMPVFDGLAAAGGRLYVSLRNGTVVCLGK